MENTDSEKQLDNNNKTEEKQDGRKIKRALWRYNEDGSYNNKPFSKTYFIDYYHANKTNVECDICHRIVTKQKFKRHKLESKKCLAIQELEKKKNLYNELTKEELVEELVKETNIKIALKLK